MAATWTTTALPFSPCSNFLRFSSKCSVYDEVIVQWTYKLDSLSGLPTMESIHLAKTSSKDCRRILVAEERIVSTKFSQTTILDVRPPVDISSYDIISPSQFLTYVIIATQNFFGFGFINCSIVFQPSVAPKKPTSPENFANPILLYFRGLRSNNLAYMIASIKAVSCFGSSSFIDSDLQVYGTSIILIARIM